MRYIALAYIAYRSLCSLSLSHTLTISISNFLTILPILHTTTKFSWLLLKWVLYIPYSLCVCALYDSDIATNYIVMLRLLFLFLCCCCCHRCRFCCCCRRRLGFYDSFSFWFTFLFTLFTLSLSLFLTQLRVARHYSTTIELKRISQL